MSTIDCLFWAVAETETVAVLLDTLALYIIVASLKVGDINVTPVMDRALSLASSLACACATLRSPKGDAENTPTTSANNNATSTDDRQ